MGEIFNRLLEVICWLAIVALIFVAFYVLGYIIGYNFIGVKLGTYTFSILGVVIGIYLAERTRKRIGCSTLFFRQFSSSDIDENIKSDKQD